MGFDHKFAPAGAAFDPTSLAFTRCGLRNLPCSNEKWPFGHLVGAGDGFRTHDLFLGKEAFYC